MQKQSFFGHYLEIPLEEDPFHFFFYTQRYNSHRNMHYHNGVEIGLCTKGEGIFFLENRLFPFAKGDVSVVLKGQRHIAQSTNQNPSEWYFLTIDPVALGLDFPETLSQTIFSSRTITDLMELICAELKEHHPQREEMTLLLLQALCVWLKREDAGDSDLSKVDAVRAEMVLPALSYISRYYMEDITVDELAERCLVSTTHFRRIFKQCTGKSPMEYLCEVRLKMAAVLLRSSRDSVARIASQSGFCTISSFNRKFKEYYGVAPRIWRQNV